MTTEAIVKQNEIEMIEEDISILTKSILVLRDSDAQGTLGYSALVNQLTSALYMHKCASEGVSQCVS